MKTNYPYLDIEKRINETRKKRKMTLTQLAEKLELTPTETSRIMNGHQRFNLDRAKRIAEILNVDYRYFTYDLYAPTLEDEYELILKNEDNRFKAYIHVLRTHGYIITEKKAFAYDKCMYPLTHDFSKYEYAPDIVYEIITPDNEKHLILESAIINLFNDLFILIDSRLIRHGLL